MGALLDLLQTSFDYSSHPENVYESLGHSRTFSSQPPFENEGSAGPVSVFRSDGYDPLSSQPPFHSVSLRSANGFDYRPHPANSRQEASFQAGSGISMSPLNSNHGSQSTSPRSAASSFAFLPKSYQATSNLPPYHPGSYPTPASSIYSSASIYSQNYLHNQLEARPRLTAIARPSASGMPPPSRSSTNPSPVSPSHGLNVRDNYSSLVPRPSRYGVSHQSTIHSMTTSPLSPMSAVSRALDSSGRRDSPHPFNLPGASIPSDATHMYTPSASMVPPFDPTKPFSQIVDSNNSPIQVEIQAKIDKGFFKAESDWTCYRRNYFSVLCCYVLRPDVDLSARQLFLVRNSSRDRIQSFSVLIIAKVDGEDGKLVELVQHTPKRDKGPLTAPELTELSPHPSNGLGSYPSSSSAGRAAQVNSDFENYPSTVSPSQCVATFERIQFKKATANNGKRRAAQQYFHVVVELHAKILRAKSGEVQTVKVAHRISAPMVVRGRSPGHYSDDRRGSMGTGSGPSADFGSAQGNPGSAGPSADHLGGRNGGSYSNSGHMSSGGYQSHHMSMDHSSSDGNSMGSSVASNVGTVHLYDQQRPDPSLTEEDATKFDQYDGYQYYPATLFENASNAEPNRPILPLSLNKQPASTQTPNMGNVLAATDNMTGYYAQRMRVKAEQPPDSTLGLQSNGSRSYGSYSNESTWGDGVNVLRDCRRYQGTDTSKGYYPAMPTI